MVLHDDAGTVSYMAPDREEGSRWHTHLCELVMACSQEQGKVGKQARVGSEPNAMVDSTRVLSPQRSM